MKQQLGWGYAGCRWAQGLERPPVVILLDPLQAFVWELSCWEWRWPGMLGGGRHASEMGGTRKTGQCWVASFCPPVLVSTIASTIPERQTGMHRQKQQPGYRSRKGGQGAGRDRKTNPVADVKGPIQREPGGQRGAGGRCLPPPGDLHRRLPVPV